MIQQSPERSDAVLFGLPREVKFCKLCVISNQRPSSTVEFKNDNKKETIGFDEDGVCSACRFHARKWTQIDWEDRDRQLRELLDRHRSKEGAYDVVVPGSGGKDSIYASHVLKHKYGMHPLTVTWPPHMYTDIGRQNFESWITQGFDNISLHPNGKVHRLLTRLAFLNLLHPFQPFILGQKLVGPRIALKYGIKLVMYGESQAEGGTKVKDDGRVMPHHFFAAPNGERLNVKLGGASIGELRELGVDPSELHPYLPLDLDDVAMAGIEVHHMGYYEHWRQQEKYYYAVDHCGFKPNPERLEGTYQKYSSLDDKLDSFHYYTTFIKFGIGRASYDAAQEIRNKHITREEGVALVRRYDGEFPQKYFPEFLEYTGIDEETFWAKIDASRSPHLWTKKGNEWALRHQVA
jgi:N-acetyl sugar amidotransferase